MRKTSAIVARATLGKRSCRRQQSGKIFGVTVGPKPIPKLWMASAGMGILVWFLCMISPLSFAFGPGPMSLLAGVAPLVMGWVSRESRPSQLLGSVLVSMFAFWSMHFLINS